MAADAKISTPVVGVLHQISTHRICQEVSNAPSETAQPQVNRAAPGRNPGEPTAALVAGEVQGQRQRQIEDEDEDDWKA